MRRSASLFSAATAAFLLTGVANAEPPRVVASIVPVHSLVASVMEGVGEPELLVPANVSAHDFALKPSDMRKIASANLVVWIGETMETYLVKPLASEGAATLELLDAAGVDPHTYGHEDAHAEEHHGDAHAEEHHDHAHHDEEDHDHAHADEHHDHAHHDEEKHSEEHHGEEHHAAEAHGHGHGHHHDPLGLDPHVWLDPIRAIAMVEAVADTLAEMDPANAAQYGANATRAKAELTDLNDEITARLAPLGEQAFVTFHDAYSYFVERYGLQQVGQITVHPEQQSGAVSLGELREAVAEHGVVCAFAEPQFDPGTVQSLAGDANIKLGVLDPLGAGLNPGPALYAELLRQNAEAVANCLSAPS